MCSRSCSWWLGELGLGPGLLASRPHSVCCSCNHSTGHFPSSSSSSPKYCSHWADLGMVKKNAGPATLIWRTRDESRTTSMVFENMLHNFLFLTFQMCFLLEGSCFTRLASSVEQGEAATCFHKSPLFWTSFPFRSPQSMEQSSLSCAVSSR